MARIFSEQARKDLTFALKAAGCTQDLKGVVSSFEKLVERYSRRQNEREASKLEIFSELRWLFELANATAEVLDGLTVESRREFNRYAEGRRRLLAKADVHVCRICAALSDKDRAEGVRLDRTGSKLLLRSLLLWEKCTGKSLPDVPAWQEPRYLRWRAVRDLQRHPIWILADAVGVQLDFAAVEALTHEARCLENDARTSKVSAAPE